MSEAYEDIALQTGKISQPFVYMVGGSNFPHHSEFDKNLYYFVEPLKLLSTYH